MMVLLEESLEIVTRKISVVTKNLCEEENRLRAETWCPTIKKRIHDNKHTQMDGSFKDDCHRLKERMREMRHLVEKHVAKQIDESFKDNCHKLKERMREMRHLVEKQVAKLDKPASPSHYAPVVVIEPIDLSLQVEDSTLDVPHIVLDKFVDLALEDKGHDDVVEDGAELVKIENRDIKSASSIVCLRAFEAHLIYFDPYSMYCTPLLFVIADLYTIDVPPMFGLLVMGYYVDHCTHARKRLLFDPG